MQNGTQSSELSKGLLSHILAFFRGVSVKDITYEDIKKYSFLIRKLAHFSIFFTLGALSCWSASAIRIKRYMWISFIFCVIYACTDEIHQFFSEGREPALRDVCIDSAGALLGVFFTSFFIFCIQHIKKRRTKNVLDGN